MAISKPSPYVPSFLRAAISGSRPLSLSWSEVADTNIASTSSFQYDPHGAGIKSSQQLNVDWSQFQNHTFFMSAEAKVNLVFDTIINGFPFDGTRKDVEVFFERLTGFERWVFDNFPTYRGELAFVGCTNGGSGATLETGTYISVDNKTGALFPELSKVSSGQPILNPTGSQSMTLEIQLFVPSVANDAQVVCQMMSGSTQGFSLHLLPDTSTTDGTAEFSVVSGSAWLSTNAPLKKGKFNQIAFILNRDNGVPFLEGFLNSALVSRSTTRFDVGDMSIDSSPFLIGSGSTVNMGATTFLPTSTLSGTLDELRVFHSIRSPQQMSSYASRALYSTSDLVLYYRFNEPTGPLTSDVSDPLNAIVLDYSGNSLHALVTNFSSSLRIDAATDALNPVVNERVDSCAVLFPAYPSMLSFNQQLLVSASTYDQENPNLITKLVPLHYLLEGAAQDGFVELEGTVNQPYAGSGIPGEGKRGSVQILVSLLYIWAKFFDEIKLFIDAFSTLRTVDYDTNETVPDAFLLDTIKSFGFHLPPLFNDATIEQYVRGENIDLQDITTSVLSLREVQSQLLRRVLINLPDVLRSKGTQHSIKSFLRAVGIDPGNNIRIRESGGPTTKQLSFSRESKVEPGTMVQFATSSFVSSPFLSASRVEPGFPNIAGTFVQPTRLTSQGISNNVNDGLLTSGSWTWEGIVKYTPTNIKAMQSSIQSIVRLCVTGSVSGSSYGSAGIVANLVVISSSIDPQLVLYVRPGSLTTSPTQEISIDLPTGALFDNSSWNVSFGCQRNDEIGSIVSSSYFVRVASREATMIDATSFFEEAPHPGDVNVFRSISSNNFSGSYVAMGSNQVVLSGMGSSFLHLNDQNAAPDEARATTFDGRLSNVRFWSRALSEDEWREHVLNYNSTGVDDPLVNWNYVSSATGSFGKLRLNSLVRQDQRQANEDGTLTFPDFSENNFSLAGSGFPTDQDIIVGETFSYTYISPYFDEATSDEKIRVRSYQDLDLVQQTPWAGIAPVYEINPSEKPTDDVRFIVEFSLIDALNRDIVTMFSTLDAIDNALGAPELLFATEYPDLVNLREIYFNRIKDKLNFQAFFEFFRWFDTSIGTFIEQLIPKKTRFKGTNFTIESHMLERAKMAYQSSEIYLGDSIRNNLNANILLQQIEGTLRKH